VFVFVLLNIILYCGNILCKYLVDLEAVSLVSWIAIMEGGVGLLVSTCSPSMAVFSAPQFHNNILVDVFVCGMLCGCRIGCSCAGLGVVKFGSGCRHFSASDVSLSGRYGDFCVRVSRLGRSMVMNEYISFCILSRDLVICGLSR
jgi:hypothetical protein